MTEWSRNQILSPVGVCVMPPPPHNASRCAGYPEYIFEILDASGLFYTREIIDQLKERLGNLGILVTIGEGTFEDGLTEELRSWVESGGTWISIAGVCGQDDLLGVSAQASAFQSFGGGMGNLGEGYLEADSADHPILSHLEIPLHYFNGAPLVANGATILAHGLDAHGRETGRPIVTEITVESGRCICIAADVTGSIVRIQQGRGGVTRDGIPAPDGTAPVCDEVLKSGDGGSLDWIFDRQPVPGIPGLNAFLQPIADQWRELVLRAIFYGANLQGISIPALWLYPHNLPAIAHISLDTDGNDPEQAEILFNTLEELEVKATWCTIMPGLPRDFMLKIYDAGHELAMHYDSMTTGLHWGADQFGLQWRGLVELFDGFQPVTNKNHYLRWEGDTDIWDWCEAHQIELDQSKGASKTGEGGFNFGTCRPYFPVRFDGTKINVLELPTYTQDLEIFIPKAFLESLMTPVMKHHGVLHLLFHPAHTHKPATQQALKEAAIKGRDAGFEWWTAKDINAWERARRTAEWSEYSVSDNNVTASLSSNIAMDHAAVLWFGKPSKASNTDLRWGFEVEVEIININAEKSRIRTSKS